SYNVSSYLFCVHVCGSLQASHSFPTRRSSDLRPDGVQLASREHRLQHVRRVDGALRGAGADDRVELVDEQDDLALALGDLLEDGDRKSTRLNSSHLGISYAVFCLKKKNLLSRT